MKEKFYAVKDKDNKLIFNNYEDVKKILPTLKSPTHKSFSTLEEAKAFLDGKEIQTEVSGPIAYIDGSYDDKTGCYSFGGVLIIDDNIYQFNKKYEPDEYSSMRNVAGEIKGAGYIINYCINRGIKEINIFYDYIGIEMWYTGAWKAKSKIAVDYVNFLNKNKDKIKINFHKVKSHTNVKYNDMADMLAKKVLGLL